MTNYAITTQYLIDLFQDNTLVNKVLFGSIDAKSLNKNDLYPLVHIMPTQVTLEGNRIHIGYDIAVVDIRTIPNHNLTGIFHDNLIDNLNTSSQILLHGLTKLELQRNDFDIELVSSSSAQPIIFADVNLLDGFECSIILSYQNELTTC